jgi:hypothetical protein
MPRAIWSWSFITATCAVAWLSGSPACAQERLSYADLVGRLTDLEHLAVLPAPGSTCAQWSSYDRASKYDEKTGKYIAWDANGDGGGIIRREGNRSVLAEMKGPGCIWRIWSALPKKGHIKIYLDGQEKPVIDMPFVDYFDGKHAPFAYPSLSYRLEDIGCRGQNLYFPIPYQKSCKIVADDQWGDYYHFDYETFPKTTTVPTFNPSLAGKNADALKKVDRFFREKLGSDPAGARDGEQTETKTVRVAPGQTATIVELAGPRAITAIRVKASFGDREDQMAGARKLVLQIRWDDEKTPSVWTPLGDFFGTAPGVNYFRSFPTGITKDGAYALWYMPFARKAVAELVNDDKVDREVSFEVVHAPLKRSFDGLGHFHAKWHRDIFPLDGERQIDWSLLRTEGRGRFCGVMLHVWNPRGGWWGEGDEKFFVDGEKLPSFFGTGSEDYFGYAWGDPRLFEKPYHAQTMTEDNAGHQSVVRWHIVDNVPFQKSFDGYIEKYFKNDGGTLFAAMVCWYQAPGGKDLIGPTPAENRHDYYVRPPRMEGGFHVLGTPPGTVQTQAMTGFGQNVWTKNDQLWWTDAKPGDRLDIELKAKQTGKYRIKAAMTKAIDYAIVQVSVDGRKLGDPINLYNETVIRTQPLLDLGVCELKEGDHTLSIKIVGADEKAKKSYMVGLDDVVLEAIPQ